MSKCILWQGPVFAGGYGRVGHNTLAHRAVYEAARGSIPAGLHVHHECGVRLCVNVEHLRLVTASDHLRIHDPLSARYATPQTHCKRGHEFTEANTWRDKRGSRYCRACARERARATQQKGLAA